MFLAAVTSVVLTTIATLYIQPKLMSTDFLVESLSKSLENNMLRKSTVKHYVETPITKKFELQPQVPYQKMVCGPRGVGKSTAVFKAMEGKRGVIHVKLSSCNAETFFSTVLNQLRFKHHEIPNDALLIQALLNIDERKGNKPTFIIEVNEKCKADDLSALLILLKDLGSDQNLATFIVVLSTSRALMLPIPLKELRVRVQTMENPPEHVIKSYLEKFLLNWMIL